MEHETKIRIPLWIYPKTERKIDKHYKADNCKSPSEFIEKAILFYIGYLSQQDNLNYISPMITETGTGNAKQSYSLRKLLGGFEHSWRVCGNLLCRGNERRTR